MCSVVCSCDTSWCFHSCWQCALAWLQEPSNRYGGDALFFSLYTHTSTKHCITPPLLLLPTKTHHHFTYHPFTHHPCKHTQREVDVLLRGGGHIDLLSARKKPKEWIPDAVWANVLALAETDTFWCVVGVKGAVLWVGTCISKASQDDCLHLLGISIPSQYHLNTITTPSQHHLNTISTLSTISPCAPPAHPSHHHFPTTTIPPPPQKNRDLPDLIAKADAPWRQWHESQAPEANKPPEYTKLSPFHKMCLVRVWVWVQESVLGWVGRDVPRDAHFAR